MPESALRLHSEDAGMTGAEVQRRAHRALDLLLESSVASLTARWSRRGIGSESWSRIAG